MGLVNEVVDVIKVGRGAVRVKKEEHNFKNVVEYLKGNGSGNIFDVAEELSIEIKNVFEIFIKLENENIIRDIKADGFSRFEMFRIIDKKTLELL